jgi:hypothetical protein
LKVIQLNLAAESEKEREEWIAALRESGARPYSRNWDNESIHSNSSTRTMSTIRSYKSSLFKNVFYYLKLDSFFNISNIRLGELA